MPNPIELPRTPRIPKKDVEDLVTDLAYGALNNLWPPVMELIDGQLHPHFYDYNNSIGGSFREKWIHTKVRFPNINWLVAYGYLQLAEPRLTDYEIMNKVPLKYTLTKTAYELGERASSPTSVFISYKHSVSSLLALTLEARLTMANVGPVFWDKYLQFGGDWHSQLEQRVRESNFVVCLIGGADTFKSTNVLEEIRWAYDAEGCILIPFWHGVTPDSNICPEGMDYLAMIHACVVRGETAENYDTEINKLIGQLRILST